MRFDTVPYSLDESLTRIEALKDIPNQYIEDPSTEGGDQARKAGVFIANRTVLCASFYEVKEDKDKVMLLAKRWRSLLSEINAIAASYRKGGILEIQDSNVFITLDTPYKVDVEAAVDMAAQVRSLVDIINFVFKDLTAIKVVIGIDYGEVILLKRKPYLDKDEVDVENCKGGAKNKAASLTIYEAGYVVISNSVKRNLSTIYRDFFPTEIAGKDASSGSIINTQMSNWLKGQKDSNKTRDQ